VADRSVMQTTILLLSSEPVVRLVIAEILERAGYTVLSAEDIGKAVDFLNDATADLLIIRPYIAELTGIEAAKYLRTRSPAIPVLIVAGLIDDDRIENRVTLQRFKVFPKPFTAAQLLAEVKEVLSTGAAAAGQD
jgi:DNA-binding NtrC family response regulator